MQDATGNQRCLTILCRLTGPDLLLSLWPVILQIARLVAGFPRERPSPAGMFEFETQLDSLLREMGRRIVEWRLNRLEPADRQRMPKHFVFVYRPKNVTVHGFLGFNPNIVCKHFVLAHKMWCNSVHRFVVGYYPPTWRNAHPTPVRIVHACRRRSRSW